MKYKLISSATLPGKNKPPVEEKSPADEKIQFNLLSFIVFLLAVPSTYILKIGGELYLTELLLPVVAIALVLLGKTKIFRVKIFWQFVAACIIMMIGFIVTDLVAGTDPSKYVRAWGRNFLLFSDLVSLAIIVGYDKRLLWWFLLGLAVGAIVQLMLAGVPITVWKIGYGGRIILLTLLIGIFFPKRFTMFSMLFLAVISISLDSRSVGAICLIISGIIFLRVKYPNGIKIRPGTILRIAVSGALVISILVALMIQTEDDFSNRRASSSFGRFAALGIGLTAITDSPILGHGSWGEGTKKYADMYHEEQLINIKESDRVSILYKSDIFLPHSQLLQGWIEGGVLAAFFFFFLGYQLIIGIKYIILTRPLDGLTALFSWQLIKSLWHLIMSPYSGGHRFGIAISIAIVCILFMERKARNVASNSEIKKI